MFIDSSAFIAIMAGNEGHDSLLSKLAASTVRPITAHHVRAYVISKLCEEHALATMSNRPAYKAITIANELFDRALLLLQCSERAATKDAIIAAEYFRCDFPDLHQDDVLSLAIAMLSRRKLLTTRADLETIKFNHIET